MDTFFTDVKKKLKEKENKSQSLQHLWVFLPESYGQRPEESAVKHVR